VNVLAVVAHPDDEVLGMGGTLARHAVAGDTVHVLILSDGVAARVDEVTAEVSERIDRRRDRSQEACARLNVSTVAHEEFPDNAFDSVPLLDLVKRVETTVAKREPAVVYTHHPGDLNVDHELTARATVTATRPLADGPVERVLAAETLSATEWGVPTPDNAFQPTSFVEVTGTLETKLNALEVYEDELREPPHPRTLETVERNARVWGAKAGFEAAEPFALLRECRGQGETKSFR
jgi:LmbE family N-acetylglucosaminyl deacetylase